MKHLKWRSKQGLRGLRLLLIEVMTALLCVVGMPAMALLSSAPTQQISQSISQPSPDQLKQARRFYGDGQYAQALTLWQQLAQAYGRQGDSINQAMVLNNLTLVYLKLGDDEGANEAIDESFARLDADTSDSYHQRILAQALATKGQLRLRQGKTEQALMLFAQATDYYRTVDDRAGVFRARLNQAEVLRIQGRYRQALRLITEINDALQTEPDSQLKVLGLQKLGDLMRLVAAPSDAIAVLEQSLALAKQLDLADSEAMALVHLGNVADTQKETSQAIDYYRQAAAVNPAVTVRLQALVNEFNLLVREQNLEQAQPLVSEIIGLLAQVPPGRLAIYSQINLTQTLLKTDPPLLPVDDVAQLAVAAIEQATQLNDSQAKSYALGNLGAVYEYSQQPEEAIRLTQQALALAQAANAGHVVYQWQWQLGRLYEATGQRQEAIATYGDAIATLQSLRQDLVSVNPEVRFSFREGVEPIYRQLVSLLLDTPAGSATEESNLLQARNVIESLQLEELVNFFRADCVVENPVQIDQVDQQAAVIYPIILEDRLEVVLSLPGQAIKHYSADVPKAEVDQTIVSLLDEIFLDPTIFTASRSRFATADDAWPADRAFDASPRQQNGLFLPYAQQLYRWIIQPLEADLAEAKTATLVFVLDGKLRNLPMAVLHDGSQYLVEKYAIALTPGLQLLEPQPLRQRSLQTVVAGLSEARQGFTPLPGVAKEIDAIRSKVRSKVLFNQAFSGDAFRATVDEAPFPVVHLATHGQFSSDPDETFILTWDDRINVNQLSSLLQTSEISREQPIELLILSACETASGDDRAALGLAGVAVRSGARSTLATLWPVDDFSTADFMDQLYTDLAALRTSKAEMLRQAQLRLLHSDNYNHPFFWAPFVLVGNWL